MYGELLSQLYISHQQIGQKHNNNTYSTDFRQWRKATAENRIHMTAHLPDSAVGVVIPRQNVPRRR